MGIVMIQHILGITMIKDIGARNQSLEGVRQIMLFGSVRPKGRSDMTLILDNLGMNISIMIYGGLGYKPIIIVD